LYQPHRRVLTVLIYLISDYQLQRPRLGRESKEAQVVIPFSEVHGLIRMQYDSTPRNLVHLALEERVPIKFPSSFEVVCLYLHLRPMDEKPDQER